MKASIAAARQAQAAESVAEAVVSIQAQLDRVEATLNQLLEALAHEAADDAATESKPKRGRPPAKGE